MFVVVGGECFDSVGGCGVNGCARGFGSSVVIFEKGGMVIVGRSCSVVQAPRIFCNTARPIRQGPDSARLDSVETRSRPVHHRQIE
jgi:hypothetical protein